MADSAAGLPETIECPLCLGNGKLSRAEVLERLGIRDFARVAQLSAEEAIRLLIVKEEQDEQGRWMRFEAELARRVAKATTEHHAELQRVHARMSELAAAQGLAEEQKAAEVA